MPDNDFIDALAAERELVFGTTWHEALVTDQSALGSSTANATAHALFAQVCGDRADQQEAAKLYEELTRE